MAFMELQITRKGTLATVDCSRCGSTIYTHEWASCDFNNERDAMQKNTIWCVECNGKGDRTTYVESKNVYAGRYSAPGYMDCTDWHYDTNKRRLEKELRAMYA